MTRTYEELIQLETIDERFDYLALRGEVGIATFGFERYLNQRFYTSRDWRQLRHYIIARDEGCDLAFPGREIYAKPIIHHMNPITAEDITEGNNAIFDPEQLILVSLRTHNAIHYGNERQLLRPLTPRQSGDTKLW